MIQCPECGEALTVSRDQQPLAHLDTTLGHYKFSLCWLVEAPVACFKCGTPIPVEKWEQLLPVEIPITEGARLMSKRNPKRYDKERGTASANKLWAARKGKGIELLSDE